MNKKELEYRVFDGDSLNFISHEIANASCDISDSKENKIKSFKIKITIETEED